MGVVMLVLAKEFVETNLCCQLAERFALYYLAARVGQETFALAGEVVIDYLAYHSVQNGIPKELQPFVVKRRPALGVSKHGPVHQCLLIETYLVRIEAQHITKGAIKLLFFTERQLYRVYQVNGRHSLILRIS